MNETYGSLRVIAPADNIGRYTAWLCRCECGTEVVKRQADIRFGLIKSCGCKKADRAALMGKLNRRLIEPGSRFGKLVVIKEVEASKFSDGRTMYRYLVRCDCGVQKVVPSQKLTARALVSCGCAKRGTSAPLLPAKRRATAAVGESKRRALKSRAEGSFTTGQIAELHKKQQGRCAWCAKKLGEKFHRDHRIPLSKGGSNRITNIELLCPTCNVRKQAQDPIEWARKNGKLL